MNIELFCLVILTILYPLVLHRLERKREKWQTRAIMFAMFLIYAALITASYMSE